MAVELEEKVMRKIGLGQHYNWFNGSGSCGYIARNAVDNLLRVAQKNNLVITDVWLAHCRKALRVDGSVGNFTLTNTWIACSYAIQDAIYRASGRSGFIPQENWHFWNQQERARWEQQEAMNKIGFRKGFGKRAARFDFDDE